ncbi:MAG: pseudouridine synthase, partial [Myxococcaceae bacterium]
MKRKSFQAETNAPLGELVKGTLGEELVALISRGAVYVDGRRTRDAAAPVRKGQTVMAVVEEAGVAANAPAEALPPLRILFEDRDVIAVDKPAGVTAQPTPSRAGESLVDQVTAHLGRDAGMVHRLDRETSGITIFGKSKDATSAVAEAFRHRKAEKRYLAVTGPGM